MLKEGNFSEPSHDLRPALLSEVGARAGLILMIVIEQNGLDIRHFEAHRLDVLLNLAGSLRERRAEHNVALGRSQQIHLAVGDADEVEVPHDLHRLSRIAHILDLRPDLDGLRGYFLAVFGLGRGERWFGSNRCLSPKSRAKDTDQRTRQEPS